MENISRSKMTTIVTIIIGNANNAVGDPHYGGLVVKLLHHWASSLTLTIETRQHYCCHFTLIFCARIWSSQPNHAEISVVLLLAYSVYS